MTRDRLDGELGKLQGPPTCGTLGLDELESVSLHPLQGVTNSELSAPEIQVILL